jgi:uncharacterized coiled-coil DUF342 family protein
MKKTKVTGIRRKSHPTEPKKATTRTMNEEITPFDEAFPKVRAAHDKMDEKVAEMLEGKTSLKEAKAAIKEAEAALKDARKKIADMPSAPKKKG